jgi:FRG domain
VLAVYRPVIPDSATINKGQHEDALDSFRRECAAAGYERADGLIDLAEVQHYGLATDLLDWTSNPMVALFFACSEEQEEDGAVFTFNKQETVSEEEEKGDNWKEIKGLKLYNPPLVDARIARQGDYLRCKLRTKDRCERS